MERPIIFLRKVEMANYWSRLLAAVFVLGAVVLVSLAALNWLIVEQAGDAVGEDDGSITTVLDNHVGPFITLDFEDPTDVWDNTIVLDLGRGVSITESGASMEFRFDEDADVLCGPQDPPAGICMSLPGLQLLQPEKLNVGDRFDAEFSIGGNATAVITMLE